MKTHTLKIICLTFGTVFLTSCTSMLFTSLDVLRPAKVAFAAQANRLLIVNNTVTQPADYGHKKQLLNDNVKNVLIPTDSLSIFCLGALTEELNGKDFFSSVQLIPNSLSTKTDFTTINMLNADSVKKLCASHQVDVILSLDKIKVNDELSEYYLAESSSYLSTLDIKFETSWSIHYPNNSEISQIQFKDTVYWEGESYTERKATSELPNRLDALVDGALSVGHKSVNRFIPYWKKVDRYLFNSGNKGMKQGMDSFYVKNWEASIGCWEKTMQKSKSSRIKAQAANNIAISYEILGDIDKALEYAVLSYYSFGKMSIVDYQTFQRIAEYVNELKQRKDDIAVLNKQLGK